MGDVKWPPEQKNAIDIRDSKTLVAAGAGSGKTAVLVERIIRKIIDDGVDIDKMLIVTFTNAAASEMKERIRKRLYEEVNSNHSLQKQIMYLNRSSIMTIDAFCKKSIKDYFYKLDIDPNFKIVDNTERELLKLEAIDEILEELYELNDKEIIDVIDAYSSNKSDDSLIELVFSIHNFIQSCPYPLKWLDEKCNMYDIHDDDFGKTIWGKIILKSARSLVKEISEELRTLELELLEDPINAKNYLATVQDDIFKLDAVRKNCISWDDYHNTLKNIEFARLTQAPKLDPNLKEEVKAIRDKMKHFVGKYLRDSVFISSSEEILNDLKQAFAHAVGIKKIVYLFDERFKKKKYDKNLLDFSDIQHLCLQLFENHEDVLKDFKNKYEEILIDEYQDSNLIQETILNKIAKGNIFMVGDVKQSIYKFRQARPELFLEKYQTYSSYTSECGTHPEARENKILLFKNFRSNENIVNQVNFIFKTIMHQETGEIEYDEVEFLKYGADYYTYDGEPAELHLIETKKNSVNLIGEDDESESEDVEELENLQTEARVVAKRIEELVGNFEVYDKDLKAKRKAKYSDIVILLRAAKKTAETFCEELAIRNIPSYADVKLGYFDNTEIQIFLSLLKIIDNPYQDIPLLAVLKSPIANFDVNDLTRIRLYDKKSPFYDAMLIAASQGDEKTKAFINRLNEWRQKSRYMLIDEFISYLYDDTNYYYYVSLLPNGDSRQNNLKVLLKKATDFEKSSFKGLYNFLTFMDNIKMSSGEDTPSQISENADVVRIMSIHKSKGLEFPIVFISNTSRKFNDKDFKKPIIIHQDLGFGFDIIDPKLRMSYESIPKLALVFKSQQEMIAEEMRILYVAMTRAKEKLIFTSSCSNIEKKMLAYESPLSNYKITSANSFADWVYNAVISTQNDWEIKTWTYKDVISEDTIEEDDNVVKANAESITEGISSTQNEIKETPLSDVELSFIEKRFNWKYDYALSTKIPSKLSVSELKRLHNLAEPSLIQKVRSVETPKFLEEDAIVGASYGTLLHSKMERLEYSVYYTASSSIEDLLSDVEEGRTKESLKKDISTFVKSPLYTEIKNSKRIHREVPFNLSISAKDIFKFEENSKDDTIMVQGIIDLYYETEEGIIIVDYKSDRLHNANEFVERYGKQLEYYQKALEKITGKRVLKSYIYSFKLQETIEV